MTGRKSLAKFCDRLDLLDARLDAEWKNFLPRAQTPESCIDAHGRARADLRCAQNALRELRKALHAEMRERR